ncbi:hypothetical protein ACFWPV_26055 [Streptomyces uncialis]|uniref:hypothetical protein n=1 Tax=Streptomyces uncialis TaxID=1048205 RepID=UPI0036660971
MTSSSVPAPFVPAPSGWRIALGDPENRDIGIVPLVGWQLLADGAPCSISSTLLEPVVLFDNVREPGIRTVLETLAGYPEGSYVHQVLAPGVDLRDVPEGWDVVVYRG